MIVSSLLLILLLIVIGSFEIFKTAKHVKVVSVLLGVAVFYIALFNVTNNSDWEVYEAMFNGYLLSNDFLFNYISNYFYTRGHEYESVYKLHIFVMGVSFLYFVSRFSKQNVFLIILLYLFFQIIPLSNQIRYFVAYGFFLLSVYELFVRKNKLTFIVFLTLSVLSHAGILLMIPFIYIYTKIDDNILIKRLLQYSVIFSIVLFIVFRIGLKLLSHFMSYFESEMISSFSGGLFSNFILVIWIYIIIKRNVFIVNTRAENIENDQKYKLLYKLSIYSIAFVPSGIFLQIVSHRYVAASFIVWICYLLYTLTFVESIKERISFLMKFITLSAFTYLYIYVLPQILINESNLEVVEELFKSNTLFNSL